MTANTHVATLQYNKLLAAQVLSSSGANSGVVVPVGAHDQAPSAGRTVPRHPPFACHSSSGSALARHTLGRDTASSWSGSSRPTGLTSQRGPPSTSRCVDCTASAAGSERRAATTTSAMRCTGSCSGSRESRRRSSRGERTPRSSAPSPQTSPTSRGAGSTARASILSAACCRAGRAGCRRRIAIEAPVQADGCRR